MDNKALKKLLLESTGKSSSEIDSFIEGVIGIIKDRCADMDTIAIPGFGTFEPRKRLERINIHPTSGKRILIPPKISLTFKTSAVLKQKLKDTSV